jgi:ubiquinone/menaquinone biosynthesis C-methylase UbiE
MLDAQRERSLRPRDVVRRLKLKPDAIVADIGAGPGFFTIHLADSVPHGRVIATDIRADVLAIAARRAKANRSCNVETRVVQPDRCGLEPGSIDLALLCQLDHHLAHPDGYLRALTTALRLGGRIVLINHTTHYRASVAAARTAGLTLIDDWSPSLSHFMLTLAPGNS